MGVRDGEQSPLWVVTADLPDEAVGRAGAYITLASGDAVYASLIAGPGILRVPVDGSAATLLAAQEARGMGFDANNVYFASSDTLAMIPKSGGARTHLALSWSVRAGASRLLPQTPSPGPSGVPGDRAAVPAPRPPRADPHPSGPGPHPADRRADLPGPRPDLPRADAHPPGSRPQSPDAGPHPQHSDRDRGAAALCPPGAAGRGRRSPAATAP